MSVKVQRMERDLFDVTIGAYLKAHEAQMVASLFSAMGFHEIADELIEETQ